MQNEYKDECIHKELFLKYCDVFSKNKIRTKNK